MKDQTDCGSTQARHIKNSRWSCNILNSYACVVLAPTFQVDCNVIKKKFYAACNSILCHSRRNCELVRLQLIKSFCLPLLTYCLGAIDLSRNKLKEVGVCWNDSFRKIFGYHRGEFMKELQWYLRELLFDFIYDLYRWKFLTNRYMSDKFSLLMDISNWQFGYVTKLVTMYGEDATSQRDMDMCIDDYFTGIISTRVTVLCDHC